MPEFNTHGAAIFNHDPSHGRVRLQRQVFVGADRIEEGVGRAEPLRSEQGPLEKADAAFIAGVEVVGPLDAERLHGRDENLRDPADVPEIRNFQRAGAAMAVIGQALVSLLAFEMRQDIVPAPAGAAQFTVPGVVILARATGIDQGIHGASATQDTRLSNVDAAPVERSLRHRSVGLEETSGAGHYFEGAGRHFNQHAAVLGAFLQQQHARALFRDQTAGGNTACAARANHDVIEFVHSILPVAEETGVARPPPAAVPR